MKKLQFRNSSLIASIQLLLANTPRRLSGYQVVLERRLEVQKVSRGNVSRRGRARIAIGANLAATSCRPAPAFLTSSMQ